MNYFYIESVWALVNETVSHVSMYLMLSLVLECPKIIIYPNISLNPRNHTDTCLGTVFIRFLGVSGKLEQMVIF